MLDDYPYPAVSQQGFQQASQTYEVNAVGCMCRAQVLSVLIQCRCQLTEHRNDLLADMGYCARPSLKIAVLCHEGEDLNHI